MFQHTAARRRLGPPSDGKQIQNKFQHTAARRRLVRQIEDNKLDDPVSTHSRPKAAGPSPSRTKRQPRRFNTQPPEGGWASMETTFRVLPVSTHSRPKAAGADVMVDDLPPIVSTHSRPKAAGRALTLHMTEQPSFNTQPPEGGWFLPSPLQAGERGFQHTAARRRLAVNNFAVAH